MYYNKRAQVRAPHCTVHFLQTWNEMFFLPFAIPPRPCLSGRHLQWWRFWQLVVPCDDWVISKAQSRFHWWLLCQARCKLTLASLLAMLQWHGPLMGTQFCASDSSRECFILQNSKWDIGGKVWTIQQSAVVSSSELVWDELQQQVPLLGVHVASVYVALISSYRNIRDCMRVIEIFEPDLFTIDTGRTAKVGESW